MQINVNMRHLTLKVKQLHVAHTITTRNKKKAISNWQQVQLSAENIKSVAHATYKRDTKKNRN